MPPSKVRAQYASLATIAQHFDRQAMHTRRTLDQLHQRVDVLMDDKWVGQNATKFYQEMITEVFPAVKRLAAALGQAADTTRRIQQAMQQAEAEAAAVFKVSGAGSLQPGGNGAGAAPDGNGGGVRASGDLQIDAQLKSGSGLSTPAQTPGQASPGSDSAAQDVKVMTETLKKYGVTIDYVGNYTDEQKATMLRNILNAVEPLAERVADTLSKHVSISSGDYEAFKYEAFKTVYGQTEFQIEQANLIDYKNGKAFAINLDNSDTIRIASGPLMNGGNLKLGDSKVHIEPSELVAHELSHNLTGEPRNIYNGSLGRDGLSLRVSDYSSPKEITADAVAQWGLKSEGYAEVPEAWGEWIETTVIDIWDQAYRSGSSADKR